MICSNLEGQISFSQLPLRGSSRERTTCFWTHFLVHTCPAIPGETKKIKSLHKETFGIRCDILMKWHFLSNWNLHHKPSCCQPVTLSGEVNLLWLQALDKVWKVVILEFHFCTDKDEEQRQINALCDSILLYTLNKFKLLSHFSWNSIWDSQLDRKKWSRPVYTQQDERTLFSFLLLQEQNASTFFGPGSEFFPVC